MKGTAILAIGLFLTTAPLFARSPNNFTISNAKNICLLLEAKSEKAGFVKLIIVEGASKLIHEKTICYAGQVKVPYNLSELEEGNYTFASAGPEILGTQKVFLSKMHQDDVALFFEEIGDDKVKEHVFQDDVPMYNSLVDGKGNKYFERSLKLTNNFIQVFNLSDVIEENMTMVC